MFIAGEFSESEILCNVPPHTLRIDLQARRWKSDVDAESAIVDRNDNGIPIEFILIGFTPFYGNLGMRQGEEFLRLAYIGVSPKHRLLPPRCVTTSVISGKSSQKNFISYFQNLYNNRINCASVVTATRFETRSFNERDPMTGADGQKINYNAVAFSDRPAQNEEEEQLIKDVGLWLKEGKGAEMASNALKSVIPGADLIELPLGEDHTALKKAFQAARNVPSTEQLASSGDPKALVAAASEPPSPKKKVELTAEQAKSLGLDF